MILKTQVFLVGAGPGDPLLLTRRAMMVLAIADVVLYDFLIPESCLRYAKKAELICVGKQKGNHTKTQSEIHDLISQFVAQSKIVVRLKGGDPAIFGRLGEEMAFLTKQRISFDVVPGVSAASSVPLTCGVSLTHRDFSRSVAYMTGSISLDVSLNDIDFPQADTIVVFMPTFQFERLIDCLLLKTRFTQQTPVLLVHRGFSAFQKISNSTLGKVVVDRDQQGIDHPCLLVVGKVVDHASCFEDINFRLLSGQRVWLTRLSDFTAHLHDQLSFLGADTSFLPLVELKKNNNSLLQISADFLTSFQFLVFTSAFAVNTFFDFCFSLGLDSRFFSFLKIVSIGDKTTLALRSFGIVPNDQAMEASQQGILDVLPDSFKGKSVFYPGSKHASDLMMKELKLRGADVTYLSIYEPHFLKSTQDIISTDYVVFLSGSAVESFYRSYALDTVFIAICFGSATACVLKKYKQDLIYVCDKPDAESIISLISSLHFL